MLGADEKARIERLCLSPYVETFNSKVIKGFVPELRSRYMFFEFRDSCVLCKYVMNISHIHVYGTWYIYIFGARARHVHIMGMVRLGYQRDDQAKNMGIYFKRLVQAMKRREKKHKAPRRKKQEKARHRKQEKNKMRKRKRKRKKKKHNCRHKAPRRKKKNSSTQKNKKTKQARRKGKEKEGEQKMKKKVCNQWVKKKRHEKKVFAHCVTLSLCQLIFGFVNLKNLNL